MLQSKLFTKTLREAPKNENSMNAKLLIRAGFIYKELSGVYVLLPLGFRVIQNIIAIVREEMNNLGANEILMSTLQNKNVWEKSRRWSDEVIDVWFKTKLYDGTELGLAPTHEEPLTALMRNFISSYKDLPIAVYQFQTKFRNELRAKSGLLRGREFIMKDLYSFHTDEKDLNKFYESVKQAYFNIFKKVGIGDKTFLTFASGGSFSRYSHEFQTLCEAGEDEIYLDKTQNIAINKEVLKEQVLKELNIDKRNLLKTKAAEVGNIFKLGTKFSEALGLSYMTRENQKRPVIMGSYGIGITRLMAVIAEVFHDKDGLIWPINIAPYKFHILMQPNQSKQRKLAEKLHRNLGNDKALLDDRDIKLSIKLKDSDLIGIPYKIIISDKNLTQGRLEVIKRDTKERKLVAINKILKYLKSLS